MLRWIDAHCDALTKLYANPSLKFAECAEGLDVNLPNMRQGRIALQCFAIYMTSAIKRPGLADCMDYVRIFHENVLASTPEMVFVRTKADLERVMRDEQNLGAMLTLEGSDLLQGDEAYLRALYELGIRMLSLTWNYANWAADGAMEPRGAGLTQKGRKFVRACERVGMMLDVSHLSERAFWDVCQESRKPLLASHSNAATLCAHPRNLSDRQIHELIARDGIIGVNFVPFFLTEGEKARIDDVIVHLEHICALGGAKNVMIGSDFDGIEEWVEGLEHAGKFKSLSERLEQSFSRETAEDIAWRNAYRFFYRCLPGAHTIDSI